MISHLIGRHAENLAAKHIKKRGYNIIASNYHSPFGEIDIIGLHQNIIIFFEVRYRKNKLYGSATDSVSAHKQKKIIKTAMYYLMEHSQYQGLEARFDVIGIDGEKKSSINWLEGAFTL